jgi:hypothetical protein
LVLLVRGVFLGCDGFSDPGAAKEDGQESDEASRGPIEWRPGIESRPLVNNDPDSLLRRKVRVTDPGPETTDVETTVESLLRVLAVSWQLGSLQILVFGTLII